MSSEIQTPKPHVETIQNNEEITPSLLRAVCEFFIKYPDRSYILRLIDEHHTVSIRPNGRVWASTLPHHKGDPSLRAQIKKTLETFLRKEMENIAHSKSISKPLLSVDKQEIRSFASLVSSEVNGVLTSLNFLLSKEEFQRLLNLFGKKNIQNYSLIDTAIEDLYKLKLTVDERKEIMNDIFDIESILKNTPGFIGFLFSLNQEKTSPLLLKYFRIRKLSVH